MGYKSDIDDVIPARNSVNHIARKMSQRTVDKRQALCLYPRNSQVVASAPSKVRRKSVLAFSENADSISARLRQ
jgi:hypothetical protein